MINASFWTSCKVSLNKVVDYVKFWHAIFMITDTPAWHGLCHNGRTEGTGVSLQITQLMLHKFTVDENVDQREISVKS